MVAEWFSFALLELEYGLVMRATSTAAWAVAIAASAVATATASACFRWSGLCMISSCCCVELSCTCGFVGFRNIHLLFSLFCNKSKNDKIGKEMNQREREGKKKKEEEERKTDLF